MPILAIDPGSEQSAVIEWDGKQIISAAIMPNNELLESMYRGIVVGEMVIEMIASYGMPVGATVFETVFWIGRFCEAWKGPFTRIYRKDVKMHLCGSTRAKDSNISQALRDRFGEKPTKLKPNPVYNGFKLKRDEWQSFALAVYFYDVFVKNYINQK